MIILVYNNKKKKKIYKLYAISSKLILIISRFVKSNYNESSSSKFINLK